MECSKNLNYLKDGAPVLRVYCDGKETKVWMSSETDINWCLRPMFNQKRGEFPIKSCDRVVSVRMDGFQHGKECHDFIPIDGEAAEAYFTYQMFGKNQIQVTNYVEDEKSYVAGFCIYTETNKSRGYLYQEKVVMDCVKSEKYVGKNRGRRIEKRENEEEGVVETVKETDRLLEY
ncbi:unnamed protein product [Caenorhabditis brenneri]